MSTKTMTPNTTMVICPFPNGGWKMSEQNETPTNEESSVVAELQREVEKLREQLNRAIKPKIK